MAADLQALRDAVDEVAAEDVSAWSETALGDELAGLRQEIDRLEAQFARRLREFTQRRRHAGDGATSVVSWLRHRCNLSAGAASQRVEVAEQLPVLPDAQASFTSGELGYHHAAVLARVVSDVGPEAARLAEPALVDAARRLDPSRLRIVARQLRHVVDPDGALATAIRDHDRRYLHLSETFDGVYALDGILDAEGGAALRTAIDSLCAPVHGDERSGAQRRADALVELATRQLQAGDLPSTRGVRPHVVVTVPASAIQREGDAAAAEMAFAGPVPSESARRLACDASVNHVVVDGDAMPLSVGRTRRTIPPAIRRALVIRDGGCRYPGCDRPPAWTDAHHIEHWADSGATELPNLVLLCRIHHRLVHEGGMKIVAQAAGGFTVRPP